MFGNAIRVRMINPDAVSPNTSFARTETDTESMKRLVKSIAKNGIIQPLLVRITGKGAYEVICGNRRLYAARLLALESVPCIIRDISRHKSAVYSVCENTVRRDLSYFEQAQCIENIIEQYRFTVPEAAQKLCLTAGEIASKLKLLELDEALRSKIYEANLSERQALLLLKLPPMMRGEAVDEIYARGLNLTQTAEYIEQLIRPAKERINKLIVGDIRLFSNSIDRAVDAMKSAGIYAKCEKLDSRDGIRYIITIPRRAGKSE